MFIGHNLYRDIAKKSDVKRRERLALPVKKNAKRVSIIVRAEKYNAEKHRTRAAGEREMSAPERESYRSSSPERRGRRVSILIRAALAPRSTEGG
jgi:hypothetical protein